MINKFFHHIQTLSFDRLRESASESVSLVQVSDVAYVHVILYLIFHEVVKTRIVYCCLTTGDLPDTPPS